MKFPAQFVHDVVKHKGFRTSLIVILLVVGAWQWNVLRKSGVRKFADKIGSIGVLWGGPQVNHANTRLFFGQHTTNGVGLFFCNIKGEKQLVVEFTSGFADLALVGWSPDDQYVGYVYGQKLWLCRSDTGRGFLDVPVGRASRAFTWLTPASFAVVSNTTLMVFTRHDQKWGVEYAVPDTLDADDLRNTLTTKSTLLARLGDRSVAWLKYGSVWKTDFGGTSECLWNGEMSPVLDFAVSSESGRLLLNCGSWGGKMYSVSPYRSNDVVALGHLAGPAAFIRQVAEINHGSGLVYLSSEMKPRGAYGSVPNLNNTLFVKETAEAKPVQVMGTNEVMDYTLCGDSLYIIGNQTGEPCGLWKYDIGSGTLTRVCPSTLPFEPKAFVMRQCCYTTNEQGRVVKYHLWTPAGKSTGNKHPALLSQTYYGGTYADAQIAARSGWCYAIADRPNWYSPTMSDWADDVFQVYQDLVRKSLIDTNRVFLSAACGEQAYAYEAVYKYPGLWKGLFLPEALVGPAPDSLKGVSVISLTKERQATRDIVSLSKYQEQLAQAGISVKFALATSEHGGFSIATHLVYLRTLADLLVQEN